MYFWCKNSAWRVFPSTRIGRGDSDVLQLHAAKGGHAYGQILLRNVKPFTILGADILTESLSSEVKVSMYMQGYEIFNDGVPYPDRLLPMEECQVLAHYTQGLWVQVNVSEQATAGRSTFDVLVRTTVGDFTAHIQLYIHNVTLPVPAEGALDHEYFFAPLIKEPNGEQWLRGTQKWWTMMEACAKAMKELRINILNITLSALMSGGSKRIDETHWKFDFTFLDEYITKFMEWGSFRRIMIQAPLQVLTGEHVSAFDENGDVVSLVTRSEEGGAFVNQLLCAVRMHFEEKGWLSMTMMHLEDEPHESENWLWLRSLVRKYMPEVPCCEPIDVYDSALALEGACDIFVPRVDIYEQGPEYFKCRQKAGYQLWCYTCCLPEDIWWLNKLIEQPAFYSRLLYWGCYSQGITGFLHWGFNWWWSKESGLSPIVRHKGDGYIVYPDAVSGGIHHSNRGIATIEGVEEYELLKIAEQRYPQATKSLAKHLVRTFQDFCDEPDCLQYARVQLFELCDLVCTPFHILDKKK